MIPRDIGAGAAPSRSTSSSPALEPQSAATTIGLAVSRAERKGAFGSNRVPCETIVSSLFEFDPVVQKQNDDKRRADEEWTRRLRGFIRLWLLEEYRQGRLSFEKVMHRVADLTKQLPEFERRSMLGGLSLHLLQIRVRTPRKRSGPRRVSLALREVATDLVRLVREREKLPTRPSKKGDPTCYERACEILAEFHIRMSPRTLEKWLF